MHTRTGEGRYVSEATWLELRSETLSGMMVAVTFATAASLLLVSSGMHETAILLTASVVGVIALGFVLLRVFDHLEVEGVPLIE
jgi:hypothetical protein